MAADDVKPTRLGAAEGAIRRFLNEIPKKYRVGLVTFSSEPFVVSPLTFDRQRLLSALQYDLVPGQGTAIGDALARAVELLQPVAAGRRARCRRGARRRPRAPRASRCPRSCCSRTAPRRAGRCSRCRAQRARSRTGSPSTRSRSARRTAPSTAAGSHGRSRRTRARCARSRSRPAASSSRPRTRHTSTPCTRTSPPGSDGRRSGAR